MRLIEYYCDVCNVRLRKERHGPDERPFVSFDVGSEHKGASLGDRFRVKDAHEVERHLCFPCLGGFAAMAEREMPKWRDSQP